MTIGENIRKARKKAKLTQKQLGELCGMADSAIRRYESGGANPKPETLKKIADALDLSLFDLYDEDFIRWAEAVDREMDKHQSLMIIAERFFSLLWIDESELVEVGYFHDNEVICISKDDVIEYEFDEDEFLNFMEDVFSYFKFKLQDIQE